MNHSWKRAVLGACLTGGLALSGCSDDEKDSDGVAGKAGAAPDAAEAGASAAEAGAGGGMAEAKPAVLVVGQISAVDSFTTYVGVFPDVPEGDVSFKTFREFGNANAYTHGGYVFVEEDGRMKRFSVTDDNKLADGPEFSWQDFGVAAINASYTVFVSDERAYTFAPELGTVIVWNPEKMEYTGELPLELPERPASMETWAYDGRLVGDKVIWNVFSGDFEGNKIYPAVTLAIADANSDAPVRFIEDERCLPGGPSFIEKDGDYLVHGGAFFGYFYAYGDAPDGKTCALRMRAGESELDQDYTLDYKDLTGSYVTEPWFRVTDGQYMTRVWDSEVEFPADPEAFWGAEALHSQLIDIEAGTVTPYPDLEGVAGIDGTTREVDGISYFQFSETGYVAGGTTDVVELHPEGIRKRFHLNGFLLGLERIR